MISAAFLRLDSAHPDDMLTDAAVQVLAVHGARGLSHRAIADCLRVTPARISQLVSRDRLAFVVTARFIQRWAAWIEYRRWLDGVLALLPVEPEEVPGVRAWLALHELGRCRPDIAELLDVARERERAALADIDGVALDPQDTDLVLATAEGLRAGLCRSQEAVTIEEARSTLGYLLSRLDVRSARPRSA